MKSYCLRNIPETMWLEARYICIEHGISFRELIFRALKDFCQRHLEGDHHDHKDSRQQ